MRHPPGGMRRRQAVVAAGYWDGVVGADASFVLIAQPLAERRSGSALGAQGLAMPGRLPESKRGVDSNGCWRLMRESDANFTWTSEGALQMHKRLPSASANVDH